VTKNKLKKRIRNIIILPAQTNYYILQGKIKHKHRIVSLQKHIPKNIHLNLNSYIGMTVKDAKKQVKIDVNNQSKLLLLLEGN